MGQVEAGWGLEVILWFQSWRTPLLETFYLIFHFLGSQEFFLLFLPLVYWCVDAAIGRRLTALFLLANWSNSWLKDLWHRPRPFTVSPEVNNVVDEYSYGIPSGHAQNATVLWGGAALSAQRRWVTVAVIVFVLLTAISRMGLGVHYPQDVIAGLLIGLVWLGLYAWLEPRLSVWLGKIGLWQQIGLAVTVTAILLSIFPLVLTKATSATMDDAVTSVAAFLGMGIGFALETRYVHFNARGVWWKRAIRYVIGIAGLAILRYGLGALFDSLEPGWVFRLIRYGLIGLWAAWGAPVMFVKMKLARARIGRT